jgi:hypothetical protein
VRRTDRLPLPERLAVDAALEAAFAPLRLRRSTVSPLRVRAAVRWGRGAPPEALRWSGAVARLSELSLAAGMSVMIFVGAFGSASVAPRGSAPAATGVAADPALYPVPRVTAPLEDEQYIRWLRLDRYVPLADWLDPTVVRTGGARSGLRLEPPAISERGPF